MAGAYDDRDGVIWMDGDFVPWRDAKVHVLTHALHYASAVFEGERAYGGEIFKSRRAYRAAAEVLRPARDAASLHRRRDRGGQGGGAGEERPRRRLCPRRSSGAARARTWASPAPRNPVHMAIAVWEWGAYYGDAKMKGAKLDISKWKRPSPETIPCFAKAAGLYMICTMSKHAAEAKGCSDAIMMDYRGYRRRGDRRQRLLRQGRRGPHARSRLLPERHHPADGDADAEGEGRQGDRAPHRAAARWPTSSNAG